MEKARKIFRFLSTTIIIATFAIGAVGCGTEGSSSVEYEVIDELFDAAENDDMSDFDNCFINEDMENNVCFAYIDPKTGWGKLKYLLNDLDRTDYEEYEPEDSVEELNNSFRERYEESIGEEDDEYDDSYDTSYDDSYDDSYDASYDDSYDDYESDGSSDDYSSFVDCDEYTYIQYRIPNNDELILTLGKYDGDWYLISFDY